MTNDDRSREQLAKLDELERQAQELLDRPHYHMRGGEPVLDPVTSEPLRDERADAARSTEQGPGEKVPAGQDAW